MNKHKTRSIFANELGMSYPTFRRKLKDKCMELPSGLLSPETQQAVMAALGCRIVGYNEGIEKRMIENERF